MTLPGTIRQTGPIPAPVHTRAPGAIRETRLPPVCACYTRAIAARRGFRLPGYPSLADLGFDGDYVSPIHLSCGNLHGPMLISKDWLDAPSARAHAPALHQTGALPGMAFMTVIDLALARLGLARQDIYVSPVFHLLTPRRSAQIPAAHARASFDAIGRLELMGRRPVALGQDAARTLAHFGIPHLTAPHPSSRTGSFAARADQIAEAISRA